MFHSVVVNGHHQLLCCIQQIGTCIYGDYKLKMNHKACSDSDPIMNVKLTLHLLARMNIFAKIDLKTAYHQIQICDNFRKITTITTPL